MIEAPATLIRPPPMTVAGSGRSMVYQNFVAFADRRFPSCTSPSVGTCTNKRRTRLYAVPPYMVEQ